jgi:hypothetical protein
MATTQTVPPIPHQVALSAIAVDAETSQRLAGFTAAITVMPAAFEGALSRKALQYGDLWDTLAERPDRTVTAADGSFRFVDLPDGAYVITLSAAPGAGRYGSAQVAFTVARDAQGEIAPRVQMVRVPPTGVRGLVNGKPPSGGARGAVAPIPAARVRVRGSGELAHTRTDGRFYLPGVEQGTLTLEITASNYEPVTRTVMIIDGMITDVGPVTLIATAHR